MSGEEKNLWLYFGRGDIEANTIKGASLQMI
jgi:hypothetical protein